MGLELLRSGTIFRQASAYAVSSFVRQHVGSHAIALRRDTARATLAYKRFGELGLSQLSYGTEVTISSTTGLDDAYHLQVVMNGQCVVHYPAAAPITLAAGTATIINPSAPIALEYSADCVKLIVNLPAPLMARCSAVSTRGSATGRRFRPTTLDLGRDCALRRMLELLCLEADQHAVPDHPVGGPMSALVATKLLELFPHEAMSSCEEETLFERVDRYIDANLRGDISAASLATELHLSVRTLYERFKRAGRSAPHTYIKERRLHRIRAQIAAGSSGARNVTEVALEYGFAHLGRFSAEYRQLFGELPSETLRRRTRGN